MTPQAELFFICSSSDGRSLCRPKRVTSNRFLAISASGSGSGDPEAAERDFRLIRLRGDQPTEGPLWSRARCQRSRRRRLPGLCLGVPTYRDRSRSHSSFDVYLVLPDRSLSGARCRSALALTTAALLVRSLVRTVRSVHGKSRRSAERDTNVVALAGTDRHRQPVGKAGRPGPANLAGLCRTRRPRRLGHQPGRRVARAGVDRAIEEASRNAPVCVTDW